MSKKLLWLDDFRDPFGEFKYFLLKYAPQYLDIPENIIWVKNYDEFIEEILTNGLPTQISFDHDLAHEHYTPESRYDDYEDWVSEQDFKEKTGMDCAKWLVDYCLDNELKLPNFTVHSQNPSGAVNIYSLLISFLKHQNI